MRGCEERVVGGVGAGRWHKVFSFLLLFSLLSGILSAEEEVQKASWFRRLFFRPSWEEVAQKSNTPEMICAMVYGNLSERSESNDIWSTAEQTWKRGWGDCEDISITIQTLCNKAGAEADVWVCYPQNLRKEAHTFVVGEWEGEAWMYNDGRYREINSAQQVDDAITRRMRMPLDKMIIVKMTLQDIEKYMSMQTRWKRG